MAETQQNDLAINYPEVKLLKVRESLAKPYPVWLLTSQGIIVQANLLASWLWEAHPHDLIDVNVFDIYSRNLNRMPKDKNREFFTKKSAMVKRFSDVLGEEYFASFIAAMKKDPVLRKIYEQAVVNPEREWSYPLRIAPQGMKNPSKLMEFDVAISRLQGDRELFLVTYKPSKSTLPLIKEQLGKLIDQYSDAAYILSANRGIETPHSSLELPSIKEKKPHSIMPFDHLISHYPTYYPALTLDSLWTIDEENEANEWLWDTSVVGRHLLELLFSSPFRPKIHNWEIVTPRVMKYFDILVAMPILEYEYENPHQSDYDQIIEHLSKLDGFQDMYQQRKSIGIPISLPENPKDHFLAWTLSLSCPISEAVQLELNSVVQHLQGEGKSYYLLTLVPENYETKVAFILMRLLHSPSAQEEMGKAPFEQYLWGLAVLMTLEEGIEREDTSARWEPYLAFRRIHSKLSTEFNKGTDDMTAVIILNLRTIIEKLNKKKIFHKGIILDILIDFCDTQPHLKKLLNVEREIHRTVKGTEARPSFDHEFHNKVRSALSEIIHSPQYGELLAYFLSAYNYRKEFPWLGESGNFPDKVNKDGLAYALRYALSTYLVPDASGLKTLIASVPLQEVHKRNKKSIGPEWVSKLSAAIPAVIHEGFGIEQFKNRLTRAGVDVVKITPSALQQQIVGAIIQYCNRRMIGTSPDPF